MTLQQFFNEHPRCALGFSGGVDSSYLLAAAKQCGAEVRPYFVRTAFQPEFELEDARRVCRELGTELTVLEHDILSVPGVVANPPERCYYCKRAIFSLIRERALSDGYDTLIDGNNASDDASDRPGMRAVKELGVLSPLRMCGLTKEAIRPLARTGAVHRLKARLRLPGHEGEHGHGHHCGGLAPRGARRGRHARDGL